MTNADPWSEYERLLTEDATRLSFGETRLLSIGRLRAEVNNGGFHQYFLNSAGDLAPDAADAAASARASLLESLIRQAIGRLGLVDCRDRKARQDALDELEPETFGDLDDAFYALEASADLDKVMRDLMG